MTKKTTKRDAAAEDVIRVIKGKRFLMHRAPEKLTPAEGKGVTRFERLLEEIWNSGGEVGDIDRKKAFQLVKGAIEKASPQELKGFEHALAEYISLCEEGCVPGHGYVEKVVRKGEWFPEII